LLDQARVLGGAAIDDGVVRTLLGAPRSEVQHDLADAVAIGDAKGVFEIVGRLVQDGQDLRNVTSESLAHFRNLLLVKAAPGQPDLVDVPDDAYDTLRIQAEKFTPGELARVLALLLAAQNDMRWTTSPRLSLELALVRATMPETDADPSGLLTRIERLERLANLDPGAVVPTPADVSQVKGPPSPVDDVEPAGAAESPHAVASPELEIVELPEVTPEISEAPASVSPAADAVTSLEAPAQQMPVPHAADAGAVDVALLRRSWQSLLDHLSSDREMILAAILESATVASYDGTTLELAFPPDRKVGPQKVDGKKSELKAVLGDMFGIRPDIVCVVREVRDASGPTTIEIVEEDEVVDEAAALKRVQEMLGAQVSGDPERAE
jgi:DNA polymerase-3 subunit gamma/tau